MWYAVYAWRGETGWQRKNVFEDETPDLVRSMTLLDYEDPEGSVALVEADTREDVESFPQYFGAWRRIPLTR